MEPKAFLEHLRRFVLDEVAAQRQQLEREWSKPPAERVADGHAIEGVRFVGLSPAGDLRLTCARNQSRFREGDVLCLNRGNPFFQPTLNATLERDDETDLLMSLNDQHTDRARQWASCSRIFADQATSLRFTTLMGAG